MSKENTILNAGQDTTMISPSRPVPILPTPYMNCIVCNKSLHVSVVDHVCVGRMK